MLVGCLAGAAAVLVAVGIAMLIRGDGAGSDPVRTAVAVEDGGRSICRAVINEVDPAWLFVSLDEPGEAQSEYIVELVFENGGSTRVGRIEVRDGHGAVAVTVDLDDQQPRAVRLVGADDELSYEATFR